MRFLGIDVGASFLKGAVLDVATGQAKHIIRTPFPPFLQGTKEVPIADILEHVASLLDRLAARAHRCAGVLLCGQMHGLVLAAADGRALGNFISWQDERGAAHFARLRGRIPADVRQALGNELRPNLPISTIFALSREGRLPAERFTACSLPDFIAAHLCGSRPVTEATNAAAHGLFDVTRNEWHAGAIRAVGIRASSFPPVVPVSTVVGELPSRWGRMPVYVPVGDQQAALLGAGISAGDLSLNIATGSQATMLSRAADPGTYQLRPFFGKWLRTVTHIPAGRSLNLFVRLLCEVHDGANPDKVWKRLENAADQLESSSLRVNLSFFSSAMGTSGSIKNIGEENFTAGHLFRASLESMAANYLTCAERISPAHAWKRLLVSGGLGLKSRVLQSAIHERFGRPPMRLAPAEDTMHGLLRLAQGLGDSAQREVA